MLTLGINHSSSQVLVFLGFLMLFYSQDYSNIFIKTKH